MAHFICPFTIWPAYNADDQLSYELFYQILHVLYLDWVSYHTKQGW